MYNVKNIRHGKDMGKMDKKSILSRWPMADLTGKPVRAGKFVISCEPVKKPKKVTKVEADGDSE